RPGRRPHLAHRGHPRWIRAGGRCPGRRGLGGRGAHQRWPPGGATMSPSTSRWSTHRQVAVVLATLLASSLLVSAAASASVAAPVRSGGAAIAAGVPLVDPGVLGPSSVDELEYDLGDQEFTPQGFGARVELKAKVYAPASIATTAPIIIV